MLSLFSKDLFEIAVVNCPTDITVSNACCIWGSCDFAFANESTEMIIGTTAPINKAIELTKVLNDSETGGWVMVVLVNTS
jgi:hypothetical protein